MRIASIFGTLALAWLAGCAAAPDPNSLDYDPLEESNRIAHENNKQIDRNRFAKKSHSGYAYATLLLWWYLDR